MRKRDFSGRKLRELARHFYDAYIFSTFPKLLDWYVETFHTMHIVLTTEKINTGDMHQLACFGGLPTCLPTCLRSPTFTNLPRQNCRLRNTFMGTYTLKKKQEFFGKGILVLGIVVRKDCVDRKSTSIFNKCFSIRNLLLSISMNFCPN